MISVRRAFLMSSIEQYLAIIINFLMIAVLARLLTPTEIGVAVIGLGISATVFSLREFTTADFLIQRHSIAEEDVRSAFTVMMVASFLLVVGLLLMAGPLSRFYGEPGLETFLQVKLIAFLLEGMALPSIALLRRDMAFGVLARTMTAASVLSAVTTIVLAWMGHSYMSYAWGMLAGALTTLVLVQFSNRPILNHVRPSFAALRDILYFGCYRGATMVLDRAYEAFPQLLLGRIMPLSAVAFYNRANAICGIPDRILLSAVFAVSFPALSAQVRQGRDVKAAYLLSLSYISVVYWPAVILVACTADAVVHIILGSAWTEVVPLVRILSLAAVFWFPVVLTNPLLLAMGKNREAFIAGLVARSFSAVILCSASFYGLIAIAASQFLVLPFQMTVALIYAKKHIAFTWRELLDAIRPSAVVTLCSVAGPVAIVLYHSRLDLTLLEFAGAVILAALGWVAGLLLTRHAFLDEVREAALAVGIRLPLAARPSPLAFGKRTAEAADETAGL
jgi:lipopolysaccharide exporter